MHGVCAHLLAASYHSEYGPHCKRQALCLVSLQAEDGDEISVARRRPLPLPAEVQEPLLQLTVEAAVLALRTEGRRSANAGGDAGNRVSLSDAAIECTNHAAAIQRCCHHIHLIPENELLQHMPTLAELREWCDSKHPRFVPTGAPGKKHWQRQENDSVTKPLFSGGKNSAGFFFSN
ncbi:hypothetical protein JKP88DRAFT_238872 [Tribonema minus]|uniref:Uncharacterized protein n=1 Tax=Tribonema minus TaxID=303371 RepID=A0A835YXG0_9STRA|nr:hypothetical protein JKP88DRAFT_238872 [Tribonema minus]